MLRGFLENRSYPPVQYSAEHEYYTREAFYKGVDFLRDSKSFPNKRVNQVATLLRRLINSNAVPLEFDRHNSLEPTLTVVGQGLDKPLLSLQIPTSFLSLISEDPFGQLILIAQIASKARDYQAGKSDKTEDRAAAFEVETILTLQRMAAKEKVSLSLNDKYKAILSRFPKGLKSLPRGVNYRTFRFGRI